MYVCMYTLMSGCVYVCMYYVNISLEKNVRLHVCMYLFMYMHVCMYAYAPKLYCSHRAVGESLSTPSSSS